MSAKPVKIIVGVDVNDEYRLLVGQGTRASEQTIIDHLQAVIAKDRDNLAARQRWGCPKCHVTADGHVASAICPNGCVGFLCECEAGDGLLQMDIDSDTHGTLDNPCQTAHCRHCDWQGVFPKKVVPKELKGWAKTAWNAGWRPPLGRSLS